MLLIKLDNHIKFKFGALSLLLLRYSKFIALKAKERLLFLGFYGIIRTPCYMCVLYYRLVYIVLPAKVSRTGKKQYLKTYIRGNTLNLYWNLSGEAG